MRRPAWPLLALVVILQGCASVARDAAARMSIAREQDLRAPASETLIQAARSASAARRADAVLAMARVQSPDYADALIRRLRDWNPEVRSLAVFALGQLGHAEKPLDEARRKAAGSLRPLLGARAAGLRAAAYAALGRVGGPDDEARLAQGLRDAQPDVRGEAALALFRLRLLERLPAYSSGTVAGLRVAFTDPVPGVRWRALYAFSRYAAPTLAAALSAALARDQDPWARFFAARSLGLAGKGGPWEALVRALKDPEYLVRLESVKALGLQSRAAYISDSAYTDPSAHVRAAVADALAATGDPALAYKLDAIEELGSGLVRAAVTAAYVKLKPRAQVYRRLEADAADARWWVRARAYELLGGLGADTRTGRRDPDPRVAAASLGGGAAETVIETVLIDTSAPLEVVGAAIEAAQKKPSAAYLDGLRAVYASSLTARYPELADDVRQAYESIVSTLALSAPSLPPMSKPAPQPSPWLSRRLPPTSVLIETEKGQIELALAVDEAPIHSAAFADSAAKGLYDGSTWHRVVAGFVVQGGDPRGSGWGDAGFTLRDEINRLPFDRGAVGMPKAGKDTGGCQLFVSVAPTPHLDGRYTVFGRVTRGMDVVDRLEPGDRIVSARLKP